jgi:beta-mannosidase
VPSGVYKPAFLVTLSESAALLDSLNEPTYPVSKSAILLEETSVDIYKYGQNMSLVDQSADWVVNVTFGIRSIKSYTAATVTLSIPELGLTSQPIALDPIQMGTDTTTFMSVNWSIPEGVPERWYPFNLGTPKLYDLTIALDPTGTEQGAVVSDECVTQTVTTGFRTIQLMQTPYSEEDVALRGITPGDQWHFEVNGKAFYSKGTGITPFDPFYARINPETVRWLLESAVKSGQNMASVIGLFEDILTDGDLGSCLGRWNLPAIG